LVLLAGCSKQESGNILTSGVHASLAATANGSGSTSLSATLHLESPLNLDFIELTNGDRLVAWQGSNERTMTETSIFNIVSYHASFDVDDENTPFRIEFRRTVDDGAPNSICKLPAPFDFTTQPPETASRAAALTVGWSPSGKGDAMRWSASGDCIEAASGSIDGDPGTLTISADTFHKKMSSDPKTTIPEKCGVTLELHRSRDGQLDPGYGKGGTIVAEQLRTSKFTSTP
jgi:hypothetical protein